MSSRPSVVPRVFGVGRATTLACLIGLALMSPDASFAAADTYANCDASTVIPILTANDFQCFLNAFAAGCT